MKLSILIPMYNAENFIERCLNSLIMQDIDKSEYEIIIFNDGSTDNSLQLVENYCKQHNNFAIYSHENQGVIATRNKLQKLAKGDYIYFLDADDYVAHNSFGKIVEFATENKLDVAGFDTLVTFDANEFNLHVKQTDCSIQKIQNGPKYLSENNNIRVEIWWYFVRRTFLEEHKISFSSKGYDDDLGYTLSIFLKAERVAHCPVQLHRYYQSQDSTMRGINKTAKRRIVEYFLALIVDFTYIINSLESKSIDYKNTVKSNFTLRRNTFAFFAIIKLCRAQFTLPMAKEKIKQLEALGAYPIKSMNNEENNILKFRVLKYALNQKPILYLMIIVYNCFTKVSFKLQKKD